MKTALAIGGGGSKGAFAVGVIEMLRKAGFQFDIVSGTSTGALIAPLVAIDDIDEMASLYTSITNSDIIRRNWRKLFWNALYDTKPLEKCIRKVINSGNRYERLMKSKCLILLCTTSLQSKKITYFSQDNTILGSTAWKDKEEFIHAILGSTNQPVIMPAQKIGNEQYVDGGVREVCPLGVLVRSDAERIFVISNSPEIDTDFTDQQFNNIAAVGMRTIGIMSTEITDNDIKGLVEYNNLLKYINDINNRALSTLPISDVKSIFGNNKLQNSKDIIIIRPEISLTFSGLDFIPEKMQEARLIGQETTKKILANKNISC